MSSAVEDDAKKEVVSLELPAPPGWKKKFFVMQGGRTPKKREIVFTSPTGDEINNKRQLDCYLKEHPGNPAASEFNWGTGEVPRRSSRISEKTKASLPPEHSLPKKRRTKLTASKTIAEKDADSQVEEDDLKEDKEEKRDPREDLEGDKQSSGREEEIEDKVTGKSELTVNDRKGTDGEKNEEKAEANALTSAEREYEVEGEEKGAPHEDLEGDKQSNGREEEIEDKVTGKSELTVSDRKGTEGEKNEEKAEANALMSEEREYEVEGEEREIGKRNELGENKVEEAVKEKDEERSERSNKVEGDATVKNESHSRKVCEVKL